MAIAYLLDPLADRLENAGLSRALAVSVIIAAALSIVVLIALLVVPALISQTVELVTIAPQLTQDLQAFLLKSFPELSDRTSAMRQALVGLGEQIRDQGMVVVNAVLGSAQSLVSILVVMLITPVVAVYMLLDWDRMVAAVDALIPRDHVVTIRQIVTDIDATLSSFVRGMLTVCLILGTYYAIALMAVGLNFGLVVGFVAGLVTFIPYLGALIGGALAIGLALFQFWGDWGSIGLVAGIFVLGQMIEGNYLTPKLVGNSVGLHPVWLLLALSVFGALFGFVGMLIAVPLAAALGVLTRFAGSAYRTGRLYTGFSGQPPTVDKEQD
jgi:predicted PurR-regulated permease PerM